MSKTIKICPNHHRLPKGFFFTWNYLKIKKGLDQFPGHIFYIIFLIKKVFFWILHKTSQISLRDCVYFPSYSVKCVSYFMLTHLMWSWHLNIKIEIWLSQEGGELFKWNKRHFWMFHKCSLLDIKNKVVKM